MAVREAHGCARQQQRSHTKVRPALIQHLFAFVSAGKKSAGAGLSSNLITPVYREEASKKGTLTAGRKSGRNISSVAVSAASGWKSAQKAAEELRSRQIT
jgi:hypothetical protein